MIGTELNQFAEAVQGAYRVEALVLLLKGLNQDFYDNVVRLEPYPNQVTDLVARANSKGWIGSFISAVIRDRPDNAFVQAFVANNPHWNATRNRAPVHPCDTLFVLGGRAFIGRADFRKYLKSMNTPTGRKVLLVTSALRFVGKTYSKELIDYLVDEQAMAAVIPIDLDQDDYDPGKLAEKLAHRLGVEGDVPKQAGQQDTRWAQELVEWLIPSRRDERPQNVWWIVLDGFREKMPSEATQEFISQLAQRIQNTSRFRLLLINYEYPLPLAVGAFTFKETVGPIRCTEIATFLTQVHKDRYGDDPGEPQLKEYVDTVNARWEQYKNEHPDAAENQLLLNMAVSDAAELIQNE